MFDCVLYLQRNNVTLQIQRNKHNEGEKGGKN